MCEEREVVVIGRRTVRRPRSGARGSRAPRLASVAVSVCVGLLACSAQASALIARGHVLATRFEGAGGTCPGRACRMAVDEATGEVFVAVRSAPREQVERFRPNASGEMNSCQRST